MNLTYLNYLIGIIFGFSIIPVIYYIFRMVIIQVENETNVLYCRFGKLKDKFEIPGLYFKFDRIFPWTQVIYISLKKDFRKFSEIHVNDSKGTTLIIDLWIEFKIVNSIKAVFQVENLEKFLQSILVSSATSILSSYEFNYIVANRAELNNILKNDIQNELIEWGIQIENVFINRVSLLPEVSKILFETVVAKLEKTKANIEEIGRLEAQLLEAETSSKIASLLAEAKGQYALSVGKAYENLSKNKEIFTAYKDLYKLSLIKSHRTIVFQGFGTDELTSVEAAMTMLPTIEDNYSVNSSKSSEVTNNPVSSNY